jgi:CAAX prenyl protease-like protein
VSKEFFLYLYPVRIILVVGFLYSFRKSYSELNWRDLRALPAVCATVAVGVVVFICWIGLDNWVFKGAGAGEGFNPFLLPSGMQLPAVIVRIIGAVLVVPVMEELFWRSFLLRYIIDPDFEKVPLGQFSWPSFLITVVLFGVEHHLILAGMVAGIFYNLLLYRTRSIAHCILAHSITNLILAGYVLYQGRWDLW